MVHPEDYDRISASITNQIKGSQADLDFVEYRIIRRDGEVRWIEDYGVTRCVIGTSAIKDRKFTEEALKLYADHIAIGIDAHNGEVAVDGWTTGGGVKAVEFALQMKEIGAKTIIFTDISRDGMLTGPAFDSTKELVDKTGLDVVASGGIGSNEDVMHIKDSGCVGVIIGKAIYEGKVDLKKCMQNV